MKKDRLTWMFAIGLLGLLGFSSCSPKLRPRRISRVIADTVRVVIPPDTANLGPMPNPDPGNFPPAKLMYGVPPARYELKKVDGTLNKIELE